MMIRKLPHDITTISFDAQPEVLVPRPVLAQLFCVRIDSIGSFVVLRSNQRS